MFIKKYMTFLLLILIGVILFNNKAKGQTEHGR